MIQYNHSSNVDIVISRFVCFELCFLKSLINQQYDMMILIGFWCIFSGCFPNKTVYCISYSCCIWCSSVVHGTKACMCIASFRCSLWTSCSLQTKICTRLFIKQDGMIVHRVHFIIAIAFHAVLLSWNKVFLYGSSNCSLNNFKTVILFLSFVLLTRIGRSCLSLH